MLGNIEAYYRLWFDTNHIYEDWARARGLTLNSLFLLHEVEKSGGCTQKELCAVLFLAKQTVSGMVKQLIENGIVEQNIGERDGREKIVTLTEKGKQITSSVFNDLLLSEAEAFERLGKPDAEVLIKLWEKLTIQLKQSLERRN